MQCFQAIVSEFHDYRRRSRTEQQKTYDELELIGGVISDELDDTTPKALVTWKNSSLQIVAITETEISFSAINEHCHRLFRDISFEIDRIIWTGYFSEHKIFKISEDFTLEDFVECYKLTAQTIHCSSRQNEIEIFVTRSSSLYKDNMEEL